MEKLWFNWTKGLSWSLGGCGGGRAWVAPSKGLEVSRTAAKRLVLGIFRSLDTRQFRNAGSAWGKGRGLSKAASLWQRTVPREREFLERKLTVSATNAPGCWQTKRAHISGAEGEAATEVGSQSLPPASELEPSTPLWLGGMAFKPPLRKRFKSHS